MMRNLSRHLNEEAALGFDWSQWQAEQLKALDALRRSNPKRYGPRFAQINAKIREALADAEARGQKEEELRILRALGGDKGPHRRLSGPQGTIQGAGYLLPHQPGQAGGPSGRHRTGFAEGGARGFAPGQ